jgi:hypothetical protein
MTEYQKILIGLLGLTHPEALASSRSQQAASASTPEGAPGQSPSAGSPLDRLKGPLLHMVRAIKFTWAALAVGSRTTTMADNSELLRDLAKHAERLYGRERTC